MASPSDVRPFEQHADFVAQPEYFRHSMRDVNDRHAATAQFGREAFASDIRYLFDAIVEFYQEKSTVGLDKYSARALSRIWKAERFSWWLTTLLHRFPDQSIFEQRIQEAELDYVVHSKAASTSLAENYVGLPL